VRVRALAAALLFSTTALADDAQPQRHVVKSGDTCASIAQKYYGDSRLVDVIHRANAELAEKPPPHDLKEGAVLVIPPKPAGGKFPDAQLTTVRNHVEVLTPESKEGKPNDPLFRGNRVSTQDQSAADVTFRDETQVKLGERTLVIILGDAKGAAQKLAPGDVQTTLVTGNLRAFMPSTRRAAPATVVTDAAKVRMFSGETQVSADPAKTTRLAVYQGSSTIDARGKTREVAKGYGSKAENGKQPTVPRLLPPATVFNVAPPLVVHDQGAPKVIAEYDIPRSAANADVHVAEWHVQVAHDGIFLDVVADTKAPGAVKKLELQVPGAGRYYVRISAIDQDGFEGPFGRTARTLVVAAKMEDLSDGRRKISVLPSDAFCVRVGNVKLARVEGPIEAGKDEPVQVRCAPHDTDPTTLVSLGTGGVAPTRH
jgi:phage tail protein X